MSEPFSEETTVEELLDRCPAANGLLIERGLPCIICGEPFWGSIADLARRHGIEDIQGLLAELNALASREAGAGRGEVTGEEESA